MMKMMTFQVMSNIFCDFSLERDQPTDRPTNGRTKWGVESRARDYKQEQIIGNNEPTAYIACKAHLNWSQPCRIQTTESFFLVGRMFSRQHYALSAFTGLFCITELSKMLGWLCPCSLLLYFILVSFFFFILLLLLWFSLLMLSFFFSLFLFRSFAFAFAFAFSFSFLFLFMHSMARNWDKLC